jgi:hypothetical protein
MAKVLELFTTNDKKDWWQKANSFVKDGQLGTAIALLGEYKTDTVTMISPELNVYGMNPSSVKASSIARSE